ncbi:MliC family protein [Vibrio sp. THAF190c]|uniref:MliC family protein n=1 Tax=Vibrio sp. THAF190c TaxID=2587865 RepID=UPI0012696175|nr:MliC family protein [Vibrio sp. THAF190c]QFT10575.1 Membrane-bound lysozyme-inhibitor of c-type lysozyme [Vibrio sp. THAF190c]
MKRQFTVCAFTLAALMGCSQSAVVEKDISSGEYMTYQCESERTFDVAYGDEQAVLRLPDNQYRLKQVVAASGTKYILDDGTTELMNGITLFTKGEHARLELGRVIYRNCRIQ